MSAKFKTHSPRLDVEPRVDILVKRQSKDDYVI